jgi:O-antigen/teichoic acid export membrane protein
MNNVDSPAGPDVAGKSKFFTGFRMFKRLDRLYLNYPRVKQVISLLSANIIIIPISIISNIFITRFLGPVSFGDFKFLFYVFSLAMVLFNFGFFQAGNRAIVLSSDPVRTREMYGSMLIILGWIFVVFVISLVAYAFLDHNIAQKGLRSVLLFVIPFSWIFLLMNYFEVLFQADNKITLLARSRLYPKVFFFIAVLVLYIMLRDFSGDRLFIIWVAFLGTHIAGFLYILQKVHPSFSNSRERIREIWQYNKSYGFNVYVGTLFNVALSSLSGLLIGYFSLTNAGVGFYALAVTISDPLNFIPNVIATTHYKEFSIRKKIEARLTKTTIMVSVAALILCWLLVGPFINIFYGAEFKPVIYLTLIVSSGIICNGLADYYNRFLGAHGQGKALRNSAIIVGVVLLICNFTLIPLFGETGAAITRILSGIVYLINMLWFYKRLVARLATQPELIDAKE